MLSVSVEDINLALQECGSFRVACERNNWKSSTLQTQLKKEGYIFKDGKYAKSVSVELEVLDKKNDITSLDDSINVIKNKLGSIVHDFLIISTELSFIYKKKLYEIKGYSNIVDFSQSELGLDKDKTYRFLKLNDTYFDSKTFNVKEEYKNFNYSQLVEMMYLPEATRKEITPDMTVRQIRNKKNNVSFKMADKKSSDVATKLFQYSIVFNDFFVGCVYASSYEVVFDELQGCNSFNFLLDSLVVSRFFFDEFEVINNDCSFRVNLIKNNKFNSECV